MQDFILGPIIDGLEAITDLTEDLAEGQVDLTLSFAEKCSGVANLKDLKF